VPGAKPVEQARLSGTFRTGFSIAHTRLFGGEKPVELLGELGAIHPAPLEFTKKLPDGLLPARAWCG